MFDDLANEAGKYVDKAGKLLDELEKIKDGISDVEYDSYKGRIKAIKDAMGNLINQIKEHTCSQTHGSGKLGGKDV